ncbi:gustatory receptor 5a for trehalose-like [Achroia grisella]|uniref:gustatory receptor 5a for trehalose-like n=1 Tax=Achroia grisella TaxID=688607 RepID=UPI0027D31F7A|nr:gustatory receptor 5a for trehalose-like [Achroia grisella]
MSNSHKYSFMEKSNNNGEFFKCVKPILVICRYMGLWPVSGTKNKSYTAAFMLDIPKVQTLFVWDFNNLIVSISSLYLENRFSNLNRILVEEQKKHSQTEKFDWSELRVHYTLLTQLVKIVDKHINPIIFVTYGGNLFFICLQFFSVIERNSATEFVHLPPCIINYTGTWPAKLFYSYSFLFVMLKTTITCGPAVLLYVASREPLKSLHTIPSSMYNSHAHRFMAQVYNSHVALSGFDFFYITQSTILHVVRLIVTYELVLMQL